jgi:hypothetical protein
MATTTTESIDQPEHPILPGVGGHDDDLPDFSEAADERHRVGMAGIAAHATAMEQDRVGPAPTLTSANKPNRSAKCGYGRLSKILQTGFRELALIATATGIGLLAARSDKAGIAIAVAIAALELLKGALDRAMKGESPQGNM